MPARKPVAEAIQPTESAAKVALRPLIDGAAGGDVEAFRELFDRYHERVHRYAYVRLGRSAEETKDVVQDVFLAVWRGLPTFRYDHEGSFPAWLFGIARRVVADHVRRSMRTRSEAEPISDEALEFEGSLVSRRMVLDAMARLPEGQSEVLLLRFFVGLPTRDVARSVGKTEQAVTALQYRALQRLRAQIGDAR